MAIADRLRTGDSAYQDRAERALRAFRALAATRPGSRTVGSVVADLVELEQPLPTQYVIGEDALRLAEERAARTDAAWRELVRRGPFFDEGTESGFAGY